MLAQSRATIRFGYRVVGEDGTRCAIGWTEHCCTDRAAKLVRPPAALVGVLAGAPRVDADLAAEFAVRR